jgi:hypothetical protein
MKSKVKYPITAQHTLFLASRLDSSEPGSAASRAPRVRITTRTRKKKHACYVTAMFRTHHRRRFCSSEVFPIYGRD